jgi:HEAT repeat protein
MIALLMSLALGAEPGSAGRPLTPLGADAPSVLPLLAEHLKDRDPSVRVTALKSLCLLGPAGRPERGRTKGAPLLKKWLANREVGAAAAGALLRLDTENKDALRLLLAALKDHAQYRQCCEAADAVANVGPAAKEAAPALRDLMRSQYPVVQVCGAAALWRVPGDADPAQPLLLEALKQSSSVRDVAARKVGEVGPAARAAVPSLLELRNHPEAHLREIAADAVRKIDPAAATRAGPP